MIPNKNSYEQGYSMATEDFRSSLLGILLKNYKLDGPPADDYDTGWDGALEAIAEDLGMALEV